MFFVSVFFTYVWCFQALGFMVNMRDILEMRWFVLSYNSCIIGVGGPTWYGSNMTARPQICQATSFLDLSMDPEILAKRCSHSIPVNRYKIKQYKTHTLVIFPLIYCLWNTRVMKQDPYGLVIYHEWVDFQLTIINLALQPNSMF